MNMKMNEVIILCGGAGTRLASVVPNKQKALAEVRGVPVLDMIISGLIQNGFKRIVLATGVRGDQVRAHVADIAVPTDCEIVVSEEKEPLGTGGAIRSALSYIHGEHFLAINGDAFFGGINFNEALEYHRGKNAGVTLVAVAPRTEADYGRVDIATDGRAGFREKAGAGSLMSAGAYWMNRRLIAELPEGPLSAENDFFPRLAAEGRLYGYRSAGYVTDIGTPERYRTANGEV